MTKTVQELNNEIVSLLADVEIALEVNAFHEAISLLNTVLILKKEKKASGIDLADAYYDLASVHLSAAKACHQSEEKAHLEEGISNIDLAIKQYPTINDHANDIKQCHDLLAELTQKLETLNSQNSAKTQYRQFLLKGTLFKSVKIKGDELHLEINSPWNTKKGFAGIRKMLSEINRDRPAFRKRLQWRKSNQFDLVKFLILDKERETPEIYLKFIQEQGVIIKNKKFLNRIPEGNIIVKVIKNADSVILELDSSLSKEDIFSFNVALYNKHFTSEEFQRYFGSPKKNRLYPTMTLMEPAKAMAEKDIKALICRLCAKAKNDNRDNDETMESEEELDNSKLTSEVPKESSVFIADDPMELQNIFQELNSNYVPFYQERKDSMEVQTFKLGRSDQNQDETAEESLSDWLKLLG